MSYNELSKIQNLVSKASQAVFLNEKLPIGILAVKAKRVAEGYPRDTTCISMYRFLSKKSENSRDIFISRGEFKDVYNKLYSNNNKFASFFKEELGLVDRPDPSNVMKRDVKENHMLTDLHDKMAKNFNTSAFEAFSEELGAVLDNKPILGYSQENAKLAKKTCARELNSLGLLPKDISVVVGQKDLLICEATYETPKGTTSVLIPVEIKQGLIIPPGMFLSTAGFVNLTSNTVKQHLQATAGKKFQVNSQELLKKISQVKNSGKKVSEVEQIVRQASLSKGTNILAGSEGILLKEIDPAHPDVKLSAPKSNKEIDSIADYLNSQDGAAEFIFGRSALEMGRSMLSLALKRAGFKAPQITVSGSQKDSITYAIAVGQFGFKTNIKFVDRKPVPPKVVVANGMVYDFSVKGLNKLVASGATDPTALVVNSPNYKVKPSELVNQVRRAMTENNFDVATDALHVLKHSGDDVAYRTAYNLFVTGLQGKTAAEKTTCSKPVKLSSSQKVICSHTGLPLDKVYQDKHGDCAPLYRRGMEDTSTEGVSMITSRIYFE